ncbi:MAG: polyamine aminopropyltransferase [Thioalkalispiraceae bacterium]|jgi:spermidine synthase
MSLPDNTWFTEEWPGEKSAISLKITEKLHEEQSAYQKIEVFQTESFGRLLTLDGLVMVTDRDNFIYHEMLSHPALFSHANPQRVLIIGGGDCGTLREVLKHDTVTHVDMVEIDERVTRVAEQFFPQLCEANHDARAHIQFDDGINWVRQCEPESYDVILIDGSDPEGPAAVLFSEEFLQACFRALKSGGVFAGQSESPLFHMELIKHVQTTLKAAGFSDVATLNFPQCTYPSGWWSATLAGKQAALGEFRQDKIIKTDYYNRDIHQAALAMPNFMKEKL